MKKAFTLIELALAIIIIGILVSTILAASEFRRAAEIRATMKQLLDYQVAYNSFQDRYDARPGDFGRAYDFWPDNCGSELFCNGNGDGLIQGYKEVHLAWMHLSNSNFIKGEFAGEGYLNDETQLRGYNAPDGYLRGTQVSLTYKMFDLDNLPNTHYLVLGGYKENDIGFGATITPLHAARIDDKMDDGTPNGHLLGRNGYRDGSWDLAECMVDEGDIPMANEGDLTGAQYYENQGNTQECILAFIVD